MACCVAFMVHWDGTSVEVTAFVGLMRRLGWFVSIGHLECLGLWGVKPLWHSQRLYCLGSVGVGCFVAFTAVEAFGLGPLFVAFRVLVVFMGHYGGTLVAFTALVWFMGLWG